MIEKGATCLRRHPIPLALRYLKGQQTMRAAPFYGAALFRSQEEAVAWLRQLTGQDFGFGRLIRAQADGDFRSLRDLGRKIVRVRI